MCVLECQVDKDHKQGQAQRLLMGAPDFSGFVAIYNAAGFPFFFTCSACD